MTTALTIQFSPTLTKEQIEHWANTIAREVRNIGSVASGIYLTREDGSMVTMPLVCRPPPACDYHAPCGKLPESHCLRCGSCDDNCICYAR